MQSPFKGWMTLKEFYEMHKTENSIGYTGFIERVVKNKPEGVHPFNRLHCVYKDNDEVKKLIDR